MYNSCKEKRKCEIIATNISTEINYPKPHYSSDTIKSQNGMENGITNGMVPFHCKTSLKPLSSCFADKTVIITRTSPISIACYDLNL